MHWKKQDEQNGKRSTLILTDLNSTCGRSSRRCREMTSSPNPEADLERWWLRTLRSKPLATWVDTKWYESNLHGESWHSHLWDIEQTEGRGPATDRDHLNRRVKKMYRPTEPLTPPSVVASCTCQEEHKSKPSKTWCHRMPLRSTKLFPACLREVQDTRTPTLQLADTSRAQDPELFLLAMKESYQIQWAEQHWTCRNAIFIHVHTFS